MMTFLGRSHARRRVGLGNTCRYLPKVVTTNSSSLMIRMLENSDLCNVGSYWLSEMYRQNDFGKIRIEGLEQKIRFGYLKIVRASADPRAFIFS